MIHQPDLDRELRAYFEAESTSQAPDGLTEAALAGVDRTRQRPAWRLADWWLRAPIVRTGPTGRIVVLAGVVGLVLLSIAIAIVIGSSRHRLPPPFGLAKPGLVAFDLASGIFVANANGTGRTQLTTGPHGDGAPTWSPDGTRIAYIAPQEDMSKALVIIDGDGRDPVTVADKLAMIGNFTWSPDSRHIAFGGRVVGSNAAHVYVAGIDDPGPVRLGKPDVFGVEPSWSPDGRTIAFKRIYPLGGQEAADGAVESQRGGPDALWLISPDGSNFHLLTTTTGSNYALWNTAWSPDGTRLAFLANGVGGRFDAYVIDADGRGEVDISNSPQDEYWPSWSPDGTRIAFPRMSLTRNEGSFVIVDPDGSDAVTLSGPLINSNTAVWSPDGKRLIGYAKDPDPGLDVNAEIAVFDPTNSTPPITFPAQGFNSATWQRLALDPER